MDDTLLSPTLTTILSDSHCIMIAAKAALAYLQLYVFATPGCSRCSSISLTISLASSSRAWKTPREFLAPKVMAGTKPALMVIRLPLNDGIGQS